MTKYEILDLVISASAAVGTIGALLFALETYRRAQSKIRFSNLRAQIVEILDTLNMLDKALAAPLFLDISHEFGTQIRRLVGEGSSVSDLSEFFSDRDNSINIGRSLVFAQGKSEFAKEIELNINKVDKLIAASRPLFPATFLIVHRCAKLISQQYYTMVRVSVARFGKPTDDTVKENAEQVSKAKNFEDAIIYAEAIVSDPMMQFIESYGQQFIDNAISIAEACLGRLGEISDSDLAKLSRIEMKIDITGGLEVDDIISAIRVWLGQIRPTFPARRWDSALDAIARLDSARKQNAD